MHRNDFLNPNPQLIVQSYLTGVQVELSLCGFNTVAADWEDRNHTPAYSKFYYILSGEGRLEVGSRVFEPGPGQIALMTEGVPQSYARTQGPPYRKYWCHFTARVGRTSLFDLVEVPLVRDVPPAEAPRLAGWFQALTDHSDGRDVCAPLHQKAALLGLLAWYLGQGPVEAAGKPESPGRRLQPCLNFIENNLAAPLTLELLAETVHLQPSYFARVFKRHLGVPPLHYVQHRRLEEAKRLLEVPSLTLREVGDRVGIPNSFYLSRLFKAQTGFSPTQYRAVRLGG